MLPYLHPLAGALVLGLLAWTAQLAARSRGERRGRAALLARHAAAGRLAAAGILLSWAGGLGASLLLRGPAEAAASGHFRAGVALAGLAAALLVTSRLMHDRRVRAVHPWIGVLALLVAGAQVFFGLQLLP